MISIVLDATIINSPTFDKTRQDLDRASFVVDSPCPEGAPLRFAVVCLGSAAQRASAFREGTRLLISGRMSSGGKDKRIHIVANLCEVLSQPAEGTNEPGR